MRVDFPIRDPAARWTITHGMGEGREHNGIDVLVEGSVGLYTPWASTVQTFTHEDGGLSMALTNADGWRMGWGHLSRVNMAGQIPANRLMAMTGDSGNVSGHEPGQTLLHLTLRPPGGTSADNVDPLDYLVDPVRGGAPMVLGMRSKNYALGPVDDDVAVGLSPLGLALLLAGLYAWSHAGK